MKNLKYLTINIFIAIIIFGLLSGKTVLAQTATPSGSLIQKLDELKKDIASKAAEIKSEINKKVSDRAIIGEILNIGDKQITIQGLASVKTANYDEFTEVIGLKNKKIKIDTLEKSDNIAILGGMDDKNVMSAKRIVYLDNYASSSAELIWGQIQKRQGSSIILKPKSGDNITIQTTNNTSFLLGNNEASIEDAKVEKFMVANGVKQKDSSIKANFIYFIPSVGFVKPSIKDASPSGK